MKIDAHHHFWKYDPYEYAWIDDNMGSIRRDFLPTDLEMELKSAGIDAVVSVEAHQSLKETEHLLEYARLHPYICGVVGWVPLFDNGLELILEHFSDFSKLKGARHVLQGQPTGYLDQKDLNHGVEILTTRNLTFDICIYENQLEEAIRFVDRHPNQIFVLDHIAKPKIRSNLIEPWQSHLKSLAERPNVYCKISGLVTEADYDSWTVEQLTPYLDIVFQEFGPKRLMFGSDWPVCLVACKYKRWVNLLSEYISTFSASEKNAIWSDTAIQAYGLKPGLVC